jgi:hypothetical protein
MKQEPAGADDPCCDRGFSAGMMDDETFIGINDKVMPHAREKKISGELGGSIDMPRRR